MINLLARWIRRLRLRWSIYRGNRAFIRYLRTNTKPRPMPQVSTDQGGFAVPDEFKPGLLRAIEEARIRRTRAND